MKLVECVPNVSEGRDRAVLDAIADAIRAVDGVSLLDVDPGAATHRTVFTFVGPPGPIEEAALAVARVATERIDMRRHRGEHPRIGALDVCPFVPVSGVTMDECVAIAQRAGRRMAEDLGVPVYLYEAAATQPGRRNLSDIRAGEYEGLERRLADPAWAPDFGPATMNPRSGATVVGARGFLVAWNVNLNTIDRGLANEIAFAIREAGRVRKDAAGTTMRDARGEPLRDPGRFRGVRAIGWVIEEYGRAQVSINLTDLASSPLHEVFDACVEEAGRLGLRVTGSEIVGLVPLSVLLDAGRHYLARQGRSRGVPEAHLVRAAVQSLGLADLAPFDPQRKVIEYRVRPEGTPLGQLSLDRLCDELSTVAPTPGGGSAGAACGALAAALTAMVANLTHGARDFAAARGEMEAVAIEAQTLKDAFLADVEADARAFDAVLAARRQPQATDEERGRREGMLQCARQGATLVPLGVLRRARRLLDLTRTVAGGLPAAASDAGAAAAAALAAAESAWLNVRVNLPDISDAAFRTATHREADALIEETRRLAGEVRDEVSRRLPAAGD